MEPFIVSRAHSCPVVRLEWDRAHEAFDAIVRAESDEAVIVTQLQDYWPQEGYRWIRRDEITELEPLPLESPAARVCQHLGALAFGVDAGLLSLPNLLSWQAFATCPVGIYEQLTGSGELLVGTIESIGTVTVAIAEITPEGTRSGNVSIRDLDEVIAFEWDTGYLRALRLLLDSSV